MSTFGQSQIIKKPHARTAYTDYQIQEFAKCADPITGPMYFLTHYFNIQHPTKGKMIYNPFDYQMGLLDSYHNYRNSISLLSRQLGKSVSAAGYLLWYAMWKPNSTILIAAHKFSGAQEIMQRIRYAYEFCPDYIRAGVTSYNKGSIEFDNGSRIIAQATTENTGRGLSISLVYCDELAFVRPSIQKLFWASISPTLSTGGKCLITSTPNGDDDLFAELWKGANKTMDEYGNQTDVGINGFKAFFADWTQHPDRDQNWASEERAKIGDDKFKVEHECQFLTYEETLINSTTLMDLSGTDPLYKTGQVRWYKKPEQGKIYVIGLDPSLGTGGDPAAIEIFEANSMTQVGEWKHNKTPIPEQIKLLHGIIEEIYEITKDHRDIYFSLENNNIGEAALISLVEFGEEKFHATMLNEPKSATSNRRYRKGFNTSHKSKINACSKLKTLIESSRMTLYSKPLISELKNFVSRNQSYSAKLGETDDLVMATILVLRMMTQLQEYEPELATSIRDYADFIEPMPFIMI